MIRSGQADTASGPLLLADISGYTSFLQAVTHAHKDDAFANGNVPDAYHVVSSLLGLIVDKLVPPFTLSKLEGDAVFAFARDGSELPRGQVLLNCLRACYAAFHEQLVEVEKIWPCNCAACARVKELDLKFVLHAGNYIVQKIAGSQEIVGSEVVMAHRLLKNHAAELLGHSAYALISDAAATRLEVPAAGSVPLTESYDHYAPIGALVFSLR